MSEESPIPLSDLTGGINTFEKDAGPNQCVEALDVWERGGDLIRRPNFKPIATGPVYALPGGKTYFKHEYPFGAFTTDSDRVGNYAANHIGGDTGRLWIGCDEAFDGIDVFITSVPTTLTANRKIALQYRDTAGVLHTAYGVVDTTSAIEAATGFSQPLMQTGRISWHRSQFVGWGLSTLASGGNAQSAFWVCINTSENVVLNGVAPVLANLTGTGNITFNGPGVRAFVTNPINGLYTCKLRHQQPVAVIGADQQVKRGQESGGNVGYLTRESDRVDIALIPDREGSGVLDQVTEPAWSHAGAPTGTIGTGGYLTKLDQSYSWNINEFRGPSIITITADPGSTTTNVVQNDITAALGNTNFEGCFLEVLTSTAGNTVGHIREIVSSDTAGIVVRPGWNNAPNSGDTFTIRRRTPWLRTRNGKRLYYINTNTAHAVVTDAGFVPTSFGEVHSTLDTNQFVNFEIGFEAPWVLRAGRNWSCAYNPVTGRIIMTNGQNGLLEYDGVQTKYLQALWNDTDGVEGAAKVQTWTGNLAEEALELGDPDINQGNQLRRTPPDASLVAFYRGHIVCVLREDPTTIQWSAPNAFNDIWPVLYQTRIRDSENTPITGLFTLNEQLIAATATGLHAANPPGADNYLIFSPIAQGLGFINQQSVAKLSFGGSSVLVGPNADGIYAFTGASPQSLLDAWERVIPGGVNTRALHKACGAVWQQENVYFLAVPSKGSDVNDRIIVMDYSTPSAIKFWLWSAPFGGISAMCRDFDDTGRERILFGTEDGHVCTLGGGLSDGVESITGFAKSPPLAFNGQTMAFPALKLMVEELGTGTLTVNTYVDQGDIKQAASKTLSGPGAVFGTGLFDTATFAKKKMLAFMIHLRAGGNDGTAFAGPTTGETFQYAIESTARFRFRSATLMATPKGIRKK